MHRGSSTLGFLVLLLLSTLIGACGSSDSSSPCGAICGCVARAAGGAGNCAAQCEQTLMTAADPRAECENLLDQAGVGQCRSECSALTGGMSRADGGVSTLPDAPPVGPGPPDAGPGVPTACGNGICEAGEDVLSCSDDCGATFVIDNQSSVTVSEFHFAPCSESTWGPDFLDGMLVPPGAQLTFIEIDPGCYDALALSSSGDSWTTFDINLTAGQNYNWSLVD